MPVIVEEDVKGRVLKKKKVLVKGIA